MTGTNRQIISVSELNREARRLLETGFPMLYVEGEISNLAQPSSGHWYFTLKDDRAQIRCAMFKNRNHLVRFKPRNGQQIVVRGRISLYEGRGEFQMIAEFLEDSGDGALRQAFDALRGSLQAEGLFDDAVKKPIPEVPAHIAIVTSPTGAAIHDVVTVMKRRFPAVHISILPVQVQGEGSVPQIVEALSFANRYQQDPFDLILLTRGGGSLEDLWSFNTEPVARAIAASELPIVCAVGHESDVSIADFVADLRAPTPSAAAELITPDGAVWQDRIEQLERRLTYTIVQSIDDGSREVNHLLRRLRHPARTLNDLSQKLDELERRLLNRGTRQYEHFNVPELSRRLKLAMQSVIAKQTAKLNAQKLPSPAAALNANQSRLKTINEKLISNVTATRTKKIARLENVAGRLNALSPLATLQRGYAIVSTAAEDHVLTRADEVKAGDQIRARLGEGSLIAEVISQEQT